MDNLIEATSCFQKIALSSGMVMVMSSQAHFSEVTSPKHSVLSSDKPQAFSIIT
jgi:hypothetical protein